MSTPLHVLIVEDSEDDALLMVRALERGGYAVRWERVETAAALSRALEDPSWDLILCDYKLPQFSGLDALTLVRQKGRDIPFLLVSGEIGEETAVAAMKAGAHDYLMKDRLHRLLPAAERELREAVVRRERLRTQAALQASEEKFTRIFQHSPVAMAIAVIEGGIVMEVNEAFLRMTGFDRTELIGHATPELGLWVDPGERQRIIAAVARNQRVEGRQVMLRIKSGQTLPTLFFAEAIKVGGTPCLLSSAIDISERVQAEERYRSLFENAPVGIYQLTPSGRMVTANRAMARMLGFDSPAALIEEVTDVAGQIYVRPGERAELLRVLGEQERVTGYELQWRRRDGTPFWISAHVRTIRDGEGNVLLYETIAEDITARRQAEEARRVSIARLRQSLAATIQAMAVVVETRDPYTAGHQKRTAELSAAIAAELGLEETRIEGVRMAGLIHDLGKIAVPAEILSKPSCLSPTEFSLIQVHSRAGFDILKEIEFPWPVARMILEHHERLDGSGYPQGLRGAGAVLQESRILQVADVVESMASHRPYRPALGLAAALEEIERNRERLYDGEVVETCLRLFREKAFAWEGDTPVDAGNGETRGESP